MAATGIAIPVWSIVNASGVPLNGAKVNAWVPSSAGAPTATRRTLYTDAELATPAANPYSLGTSGHGVLYRSPATAVTITVTDSAGATTYATTFYPADLSSSGIADLVSLVVATYAELTALTAATGLVDNGTYCTYARATEEDGGFGFWRYDAGSSTTVNGGTILAPDSGTGRFFRFYKGEINPQWFGAITGDTGNQYAAFYEAILAGPEIHIADGTYRHSAAILITDATAGKKVTGGGRRRTFLKMTPGTDFVQIALTSHNVELRDLAFQGAYNPGVYEPATTATAILVNNALATGDPVSGFRARGLNFYDQNAGGIFISGGNQGTKDLGIEDVYGYQMVRYGALTIFKGVRDLFVKSIFTEQGGPCIAGDDGTDGDAYVASITSITAANPPVVTKNSHDVETGDYLYVSGIGGMTQLNGNTYVATNTGANTFTLAVDASAFSAYTSGGYMTTLRPLENIKFTDITSRADGKFMGAGEAIMGFSGLQGAEFENITIEDGGYSDEDDVSTHRDVRAMLFNSGQDGLHRSQDIVIRGLRIRRFANQPVVLAGVKNVIIKDWVIEDCFRQNSDPGGDCPAFKLTDDTASNSCENVRIGKGRLIKNSGSYVTCLVENECTAAQNISVDWDNVSLPSGVAGYVENGQTTNTQEF